MTKTEIKRQNYFLGILGQEIVKNIFSYTTKGTRSFDLRIPTEKRERVGHRLEVKTRKIRKNGTFQVNFTRYERIHSDTFVILVLDEDLSTKKLYWIPTWRMPREKGFLYFGKKINPKYEVFRLV